MPPAPAALDGLDYDEARAALDRQAQRLIDFRARAGVVLSSATISTAFLAPLSLGDRPPPASTSPFTGTSCCLSGSPPGCARARSSRPPQCFGG